MSTSLVPIFTRSWNEPTTFTCQECSNRYWANVIPLLQMKTADIAHTGIFASVTRPFSHFWAGSGDEATVTILARLCNSQISTAISHSAKWMCNDLNCASHVLLLSAEAKANVRWIDYCRWCWHCLHCLIPFVYQLLCSVSIILSLLAYAATIC